jgi:hypothetical protein
MDARGLEYWHAGKPDFPRTREKDLVLPLANFILKKRGLVLKLTGRKRRFVRDLSVRASGTIVVHY